MLQIHFSCKTMKKDHLTLAFFFLVGCPEQSIWYCTDICERLWTISSWSSHLSQVSGKLRNVEFVCHWLFHKETHRGPLQHHIWTYCSSETSMANNMLMLKIKRPLTTIKPVCLEKQNCWFSLNCHKGRTLTLSALCCISSSFAALISQQDCQQDTGISKFDVTCYMSFQFSLMTLSFYFFIFFKFIFYLW